MKTHERRRGIASWAISRPIGTVMLTSTLLVLGLVYVGRIPVDLLPKIVYPNVRVQVNNPGVEPVVLEETIAKPLESAVAITENLRRIRTDISEGSVGVNLEFALGTNVDFALQDAAKNVERIRSRLPEEADPPTITKWDPSQMPIYSVAFSSSERNQVALREWVDQRLRPQLLAVPGVAALDISGGLVREIQVQIEPDRLRGYGLSVSQVINALRNENQDLAAGRITSDEREIVGKTAGKFRSIADISGVLLTSPSGARIPLSEIATVRDTSQQQRSWARLDGLPAVRVQIRKQPEANTVEVADGVQARLELLATSAFIPKDVRYVVTYDQSGFIRDALNSVRNATVMGAILAMLVVVVFLRSFRKTFIIGVSIPLAILATFVMMGMSDLTLNIMSLGGLALGTGLLLDNAIVMLENIYRRRERDGLDAEEGAHVGAGEVTSAVVASTTTNIASVAPFLLITGLSALVFRELILTISFAILAALPLALTLVPMLAAQLGKVRFSSGLERFPPLRAFDRGLAAMTRRYRGVAAAAVRRRWWVLAGAVTVAVGAGLLARTFDSEFLPQVDDGSVSANLRLATGSAPNLANRMTLEVESLMREMPNVRNVFATAGGGGGGWGGGSARGNLDILLVPPNERAMSADQWVQEAQRRIDERGLAGARIFVRPPRLRGIRTSNDGDAITLAIFGDELPQLEQLGREAAQRLRGVPGLENFDVQTDEGSPLLAIVLDRERARTLGLDVATVGQTVRTALDGTIATRYAQGNFEYDVRVMFPRDRFTGASEVGDILLFPGGRGSDPVFLRDVADVRAAIGPTNINRENQNRVLRLSGDVFTDIAPVSAVVDSVRARLASMSIPDGYGLVIGGDHEATQESNRQMMLVVALAIFLVFVVLAVQYESLIDPFVILLAIPLGMVGVIATLGITGTPFSAPVLLGMILLAGIVVNNSILLVEFIEHYRREEGASPEQAVVEAGAVRMRPILMTTFTSLVGTLPLALGLGSGGELMRPLAIAVVGGLLFSTMLTLFVVPCGYLVLHAAGDRLKVWLLGDRARRVPAREPEVSAGD
jgi:CzcA family heavy metal efflux pump